ncbi:MAG: inner-membrane translocator [Actinobacteria bacterium]|nr:MAG: inner-membrane translocator [Actinomycetota bacterium]
MQEFLRFTVLGIVTGAVYAVSASGLVLTYATSGIFNIAHGGIGMLMAFTYWELRINHNWPAPIAFVLVVFIAAPLLGALIERFLMRGLRNASVATSLVVTVGLMVALLGLAKTIWDPGTARRLPFFFYPRKFSVFGVNVTWHEAATLIAAAALAIFLYLLLNRTRIGIAMRAVVDDRNLLGLNGARPDQVSMLSWAIGAAMASIAGILLAPILQMDVIVLTFLVVNGYAAAMVGRLRNLPLTFVGGLLLGLIGSYTVAYFNLPDWLVGLPASLPTIFLFIMLLALPEARLRAGRLVGSVMPRVPGLRRSFGGAVGLVAAAGVLSMLLAPSDLIRAGQGLALAIIMLSLVLLTGYGGQVSLCQMTFAGVGAFAMARWGGSGSFVGIIAAGGLAALVGGIVALPSLRLQGLYLALSTMAFALLAEKMFFTQEWVFGNFGSRKVGRLDLPGISFDGERAYFVLLAIAFALLGIFVLSIRRGRFGRTLAAMRDSPVACATLGLSLTRTKLAVFMIAAGMAGIGGALYGGLKTTAGSTDFLMLQSLPLLLLAVIGGITSVGGALVGGVLFALPQIVPWAWVGSLQFLWTGIAAVTIGRNPNGVAFMISERARKLFGLYPRGGGPFPAQAPEMDVEEVHVAAPAS